MRAFNSCLIGSTCAALPGQHRRVLPGEPLAARAIVAAAAERAALARHEPRHFLEPPVEDFVEPVPGYREAVRARREPGAYTRPLISST